MSLISEPAAACGPNSVAKRYEKLDTSLAPPTDSLAPTPQPARQPAVSSRISDASTANTDGPYPSSGAAFTADHDSRPRDALDPIYMRTPKPRSVPMIRVDNPERNWSGALTVPGQHHRGSATPSPSSPQPSFRHSEQPRLDDGPPHVDVAKMREDLMQQYDPRNTQYPLTRGLTSFSEKRSLMPIRRSSNSACAMRKSRLWPAPLASTTNLGQKACRVMKSYCHHQEASTVQSRISFESILRLSSSCRQ